MKFNLKFNLKKILIISFLALVFVGCDQSSKQIAKKHLESSSMVKYLYGTVKFVYVENPGGMLSIGARLSKEIRFYILIAGVSIMLSGLFLYLVLKKKGSLLKDTSLLLIFCGGSGNLVDRVFNEGKVIDFIILGTTNFHTAVFNLADLFILAGTLLFFLSYSGKEKITNGINQGI